MKLHRQLAPEEKSKPAVAPLSAAVFATLMERFAPFGSPQIAVAVSGGPDSMALAFCAQRWLDESRNGGNITAFIVDHGLRRESTTEAWHVQRVLATIGIDAEILTWKHSPVISALHDTARRARYDLLLDACHRHRINTLMFAHQQEDQAETILMRLAKGSGIDGLAGIPVQSWRAGVRIVRPLLNIARDQLTATCDAAGLAVITDPSNQSEKYARGRLRQILPLLEYEGLTIERLTDLGARAAEAKEALDQATQTLVRLAAKTDNFGVVRLALEHLRAAPRAIGMRALATCLQKIHRDNYPPQYESLTRLFAALIDDANMPPCTLHGSFIVKGAHEAQIMRELSAISDEVPLAPGTDMVWDQRWQVSLAAAAPLDLTIRPLGNPSHEVLDRLAPGLRKTLPQGRMRAALPALWLKDALALIPALPDCSWQSLASARL